ncbi:MAG: bifunctional (p)ppGpp synthetase/guanosine-3',5'-bis(diphosphate) 3'-pyrophosphohydrolase [Candidatus Actinomarina sp.]|jgi:GTP pyrophosphokinase|nr:bifunctional (p)ppGpp synthetase/guanosine-3',5'-bis(diphosphate) 3'-pyrophosphohydrolase [Candidatus Actinomarina sp.]MBL6762824.1 bifunctional (p)ppGpp synthetase/guanosine-3',5'-bis(diphosphate) 3'-pyrophosphohydrolase [Candidatus Actinomarina sp.]MBL6836224.1 bifunctional (p)ppGpp synthetase/guanosine-3',5'-bis(diphosphate) 3'-pyrophosphohydrolase [Candidatus Actinomarina sp.]
MATIIPSKEVNKLYDKLLGYFNPKDQSYINRAFQYAYDGHNGQNRKSGEPYITHPLHVAIYLCELNFDKETIAAALLHDLIEDTEISYNDIKKEFGEEVADIVDGVTKLDKIKYSTNEEAKADAIRKMVIAMSKDIRVLILKLADRLHNIQTIEYHQDWKQEKIANETLYVYAPLAHRLGFQSIKHVLEDKSFKILHANQDKEIQDMITETNPDRDSQIGNAIEIIRTLLNDNSISAEVYGRPKHNYSIYKKIVNQGLTFNEINDLIGIRIVTDDVKNCYTILGLIHANFQPVLGRFKDFISMPKFNLYQSLHTTVLTSDGTKMEIQIRTHDMHYRAEYGVAAHWKYKEKPSNDLTSWTNTLSEISNEYPDPNEFLQHMKFDLYENEVFCLTPEGDVIALPQGSTPVDFAFAIHTQLGEKLIGAKVNGKLVNLSNLLKSGDTIEILTSKDKDKGPSRDWLNIVKTTRARSKIKQWYQKQMKNEDIQKGKTTLNSWLDENPEILEATSKDQLMDELLKDLKLPNLETLYQNLGNGNTGINSISNRINKIVFPGEISVDEDLYSPEIKQDSKSDLVIVEGYDDIKVRMGKCCVPVPGDDILGFVTISNGIAIHRSDCLNVQIDSRKGERIIDVSWGYTGNTGIIVWLEIEAIDRPYLLRDATIAISDNGGNILVAKSVTSSKRIVNLIFQVEISDNDQLDAIINDAKNIENVFDASRIYPGRK